MLFCIIARNFHIEQFEELFNTKNNNLAITETPGRVA